MDIKRNYQYIWTQKEISIYGYKKKLVYMDIKF